MRGQRRTRGSCSNKGINTFHQLLGDQLSAAKVGIIGNPNCGKTTLFNRLTGSMHHTGNWPGVTVEVRSGFLKVSPQIELIDLPGLYSLNPATPEQRVAGDFIQKNQADVYVNVVDATNLERNLFLTLQIIETGAPLILVVNMVDEAVKNGFIVDYDGLSERLNVPVVPVSASSGHGIPLFYKTLFHYLHAMRFGAEDAMVSEPVVRDLTDLAEVQNHPDIPDNSKYRDGGSRHPFVMRTGIEKSQIPWLPATDRLRHNPFSITADTALSQKRYVWIEQLCSDLIYTTDKGMNKVARIDRFFLHPRFGIPIFLGMMLFLFFLVFGPFGAFFSGLAENGLVLLQEGTENLLVKMNALPWLVRLTVDGILGGVGSVLIFVPQFALLFLGLAILEDSGYMSRAAFMMNRSMQKFGLSGKAFIPMLVGFGCNVPAIMATRTLSSERERKLTVFLLPFMSCGARMPVYAVLTAAFFGETAGVVVFALYAGGIAAAMLTGFLLRKTILRGNPPPFVIELPPYRRPTLRSLWAHIAERVGDYIKKAGTLLFAASVIVWFLQAFTPQFMLTQDPAVSIFAFIGKALAPVFQWAGFADWRISVSLLAGLAAKEAVLSSLGVLMGSAEGALSLTAALQQVLTSASALALLVFFLLYTPCMATIAAMQREFRSWKWTLGAMAWQIILAWVSAVLVYQLAKLFLG